MPNELTSPLMALIASATKLPAETGETAKHQAIIDHRLARINSAGANTVILADCSSSMSSRSGAKRCIDVLQDALDSIMSCVINSRLVAFGSFPAEVTELPEPSGGTALHLALDYAASLSPKITLVISDGCPDDKEAAFAAADRLIGIIDVLYVGDDNDRDAIQFMRELARRGGGQIIVKNIRTGSPALEMRKMLALPAPGGVA